MRNLSAYYVQLKPHLQIKCYNNIQYILYIHIVSILQYCKHGDTLFNRSVFFVCTRTMCFFLSHLRSLLCSGGFKRPKITTDTTQNEAQIFAYRFKIVFFWVGIQYHIRKYHNNQVYQYFPTHLNLTHLSQLAHILVSALNSCPQQR